MEKQHRFRNIALVFLMVGIIGAIAACGSKAGSGGDSGATEVRIAYFPNITHTQALVMKNKKMLEKKWGDKCSVTWTSFNAGPAEMEAIFAGEIDLGYIGPVPALSANVKSDGDVRIISNATNAGAVFLKRKDSDIESLADLSGKKVAVPQIGNTQHLCLLSILSSQGLKAQDAGGDVMVSASSNADILNLFDNGSVDAALVPEPWGTMIENNGNAEMLLDYDEIFLEGNYPTAVVVASRDFLEAYPELVKDFLEAHEEATLYINENPEEARLIVNEEIQAVTGKTIEDEVLKNAFTRMSVDIKLNMDAIMKFAEISANEGFIDRIPEEKDVFAAEISQ